MYKKLFLNISCFLFLFLISFLSFHGCSSEEPEDNSNKFGIYLLEDQSITWEDMKNQDLSTIKLKEWITGDKIDSYDYSSHVIYLNVDYNTLLSFPHNNNTPFVVVANDKRIYYGCFGPPADTTQPHVVLTPLKLCNDLLMLEFNPPNRKDIRVNDEIKNALQKAGKLKAGINVSITGPYNVNNSNFTPIDSLVTAVMNFTNNEDTYIYTLSNLYDFVKVENTYYQLKLVMYNDFYYYCSSKCIPTPGYNISPNIADATKPLVIYFGRTDRKKTWLEHAYFTIPENITNGTYKCYIEYYGAMGGSKENRAAYSGLPLGRNFIGYLRTNTRLAEYNRETGFKDLNKDVTLN